MMPIRKGRSTTTALLDKVTSQLKGERVKADVEKDDLKEYINSLTNTTAKLQKSVGLDADSDISISNEDYKYDASQTITQVTSKFIKKKTAPANDECIKKSAGPTTKMDTRNNLKNSQKSNDKKHFDTQAQKINTTKQNITTTSVNSMSLSDMDSDVSVHLSGRYGRSFRPASLQSLSALSDDADHIGTDGGKFLKIKSIKRDDTLSMNEKQVDNKVSAPASGPAVRRQSTPFALSSDEESLAEFIKHLSDRESVDRNAFSQPHSLSTASYSDEFKGNVLLDLESLDPVKAVGEVSNISKRTIVSSPFYKKPDIPEPKSANRSILTANVKSSSKSPFHKKNNETNGTVSKSPFYNNNKEKENVFKSSTKSPFDRHRDSSVSKSRFIASNSSVKPCNKTSTQTSNVTSDVFGMFGLQTVDDLIGVKSHSESADDGNKSRNESVSMVHSWRSSRSVPEHIASYTDDFEESITEQIRDIGSEAHNDQSRSALNRSSSTYSSTSSESSESSESSPPPSRPERTKVNVTRETRGIEVQTDYSAGMIHSWDQRMSKGFPGPYPRMGLDFVDQIPIATSVVSADAIEAITAYTPATIALHNMLKDQVQLTTQFLKAQEALYLAYKGDNRGDTAYSYTTLEDTKQYIATHRKPRLTFEDALKMVSTETT